MSNKRMFSKQIIDSDAFLDMPASSQLLYFHLVMRADDEGFVGNPKKIMREVGIQGDDFKILIAKRFLIAFESGVIVIKHWLIHNTIRMDRFNQTSYQDEKKLITTKENRAYTEVATNGLPIGNQVVPQVKLSKVKLSKKEETFFENSDIGEKKLPPSPSLADEFLNLYLAKFAQYVSKTKKPVYPKSVIIPLIEERMTEFGSERLKELLEIYMGLGDKFYEDNLWSLTCFLSNKILNKLNVGNK